MSNAAMQSITDTIPPCIADATGIVADAVDSLFNPTVAAMGITNAAVDAMLVESLTTDICGVEVATVTSTPRKAKCKACHSQWTCLSCQSGQQWRNERLAMRSAIDAPSSWSVARESRQ